MTKDISVNGTPRQKAKSADAENYIVEGAFLTQKTRSFIVRFVGEKLANKTTANTMAYVKNAGVTS